MRVILTGVVLLVAAGARGNADDRSANASPISSIQLPDRAQETPEPAVEKKTADWLKLKRGTRVRLMVEDGGPMREVAGRLLASDPTTVTVDTAGGPQRFSRDQLFHLQYRTGGRDRQKGAAIGAAITGLAGLVAGVVMVANEYDESGGCDQCGIAVGVIAFASAIPGGAIGFAIGTTGGDWHGVKPDGLTVTGAATPRRATVALRLRLP